MTEAERLINRYLSRRAFLKGAGAGVLGFTLPALLPGCGNDGSSASSTATPTASPSPSPSPTPSPTPPPPLVVDPNTPWWLEGNFAPVFDERDDFDLPVVGAIPPELNGLYVRNGSNPQKSDSPHWFFGDGMIHGVRLENGRAVSYRNRYVRTPFYEGGLSFRDYTGLPAGGNNQSNVSCVWHGGRLLTSGEVGAPHQIDPEDLATLGVFDFDGQLNTSFTAHPKIDPATGYLHFFGYWFVPPFLTYHVADAQGQIIRSQDIELAKSTMIHSFAITERDAIFWELPVLFKLSGVLEGTQFFKWQPEYGARIGVMPLGGLAADIRWVEIEPCYVFHEVNAYRSGDDVVIDVCRHDSVFGDQDLGQTNVKVHRWRVNTAGEQLSFHDEIVADRQLELPTHDRRISGRPHRYGWFVDTRYHPLTLDFAGTGLIDYKTGDLHIWDPGPTRQSNEAFFVPAGSGEGEGWLLTLVYDRGTDMSDLVILDALDIEAGPVAQIRLPRRVPHGFHGVWVPA